MYEIRFLKALALSVFTESIILFALCTKSHGLKDSISNLVRIIFASVLCTCLSIPYVWFILPKFITAKSAFAATSEVFAILVESAVLFIILQISIKKAIFFSFVCNVCSFGLGILLKWL